MSDLRELLGDDDYEATIDKAVETAERYFVTANYTHPDEGVTRCDYGCGVQLIERTVEHVTACILEAVLPDLLAQAWDEGHRASEREMTYNLTRHETPDEAKLRRKAAACVAPAAWYEVADLTDCDPPMPPDDAAFIADAGPDVVLGLLAQLAHIDAILARSDHACEPSSCDWKRDIRDIREVRGL